MLPKAGYLSWFTASARVQENSPVVLVLRCLDAEASELAWAQAETARQQLSLFGLAPPTKKGQPHGWPLRHPGGVPPYSAAVISGV